MLGNGDGVSTGSVHHGDAALSGGVEVDVIDANAGTPDHAKFLRMREQSRIHLHGGADDERVSISDVLGKIALDVIGGDDVPARLLAEERDSRGRSLLGDDDLHARPRA